MTLTRSLSRGAWMLPVTCLPLLLACEDTAGTPVATGGNAPVAGVGGSAGTPAAGGSVATGGASAGAATAGASSAGTASGGAAAGAGGTSGSTTGGATLGGGGAGGAIGGGGGAAAGNAGAGGGEALCGSLALATDGSYTRKDWTAEYTCTGGACPPKNNADTGDVEKNAFDGSYSTRWSTGVYQSKLTQFPLFFTVDLTMPVRVSKITTHPGCKDIYDAPGTISVAVSNDKVNWTTVTQTPHAPANPAPTKEDCPPKAGAVASDVITFPSTCARYIRLTGTKRTIDDRYWAIGEMTVAP